MSSRFILNEICDEICIKACVISKKGVKIFFLLYCTAHSCWDVTGYSDPFRPLNVPICGRLLEGVHKKKAVPGGCPIAKTGHQKGKKERNTALLF